MLKLFFERKLNRVDVLYIVLAAAMIGKDRWAAALVVLLIGIVVSVEGERALARSEEKSS